MGRGWEGDRIRLAPLDRQRHLENALDWMNDPETTRWLLAGEFPLTRLQEERWFEQRMASSANDVVFAIELLDSDEHIGFTGLHQIEWIHRTAMSGTLIGKAEYRGRGLGREAVQVRTRYAFETIGLRMIYSWVMAENDTSLRMLKAGGYQEVSRWPRRYWRHGKHVDAILMCIEQEKHA